jgi:murein DD-endopeptidase MepM/ murein hydrolase activator NlpD
MRRTDSGWVAGEEVTPWTIDTVVARGTIQNTLYDALQLASTDSLPTYARAALTYDLADVYEYRVDMSRDLRVGDSVQVLFERKKLATGVTRIGRILAATFRLSGQTTEAIRFERGGFTDYFDQDGKSMRSAFLRAPLAFRRISSSFGMRMHPILGIMRAHVGTDYAAAAGTPVRSVGDGFVIFAGRKGGYGNMLEIRHKNGFITRYGHLKGFASGVRQGARVSIGQTVAYVGTTGLSTAPHLHFEVLVNGVHRDPRRALESRAGDPVPAAQRAAFEEVRTQMLLAISAAPLVSLAAAAH